MRKATPGVAPLEEFFEARTHRRNHDPAEELRRFRGGAEPHFMLDGASGLHAPRGVARRDVTPLVRMHPALGVHHGEVVGQDHGFGGAVVLSNHAPLAAGTHD